jgi:hypothetical protein
MFAARSWCVVRTPLSITHTLTCNAARAGAE